VLFEFEWTPRSKQVQRTEVRVNQTVIGVATPDHREIETVMIAEVGHEVEAVTMEIAVQGAVRVMSK